MKQYPLSGQDTTTNRWKSAALSILKNRKKITTGNYNNNPQRHRFQERPTSIGSAHQFCRFDDQDFICHACGTDADQSNDDEDENLICIKCNIKIHGSCRAHPHSALCLDQETAVTDEYVVDASSSAPSPKVHSIIINDVNENERYYSIKEGRYRIHRSQNDLSSSPVDLSENHQDQKLSVDPVYLALKRGNQMSISKRRQLSPTTPNNDSSSGMLKSSNSRSTSPVTSPAVSQSPPMTSSAPSSAHSKSNLSIEDSRNDPKLTIKSTTNQPPPSKICKTPKLNAKMKSLSLDCSEFSKIHSRLAGISSVNSSPTPNRRSIRVPPCEGVNAENDMLLSNVVKCTSKCKPLTMLPNSQFAVVHNNRAKYAGECELRMGDRVVVTDMKDRDWWQGRNVDGNTGIFPATCVTHIHKNELIMQLLQNVNLVDGLRNLRLYRDQIVFASIDKPVINGFVVIRTEHNRIINCPINCLTSLEKL